MSKENLIKGRLTEQLFADTIKKLGYYSKESTLNEDRHGHFDLIISTHSKVDIKSIKVNDENHHYVELKNVQGNLGSLYGDTDYFAFETKDYFIYVDKIKLQEFIADKCKAKERCTRPEIYKLYNRADKPLERTVLIPTLDLCYIADHIFKK